LEAEHYIVDTVNRWLSCLHAEDVNDVLEYDPVLRECPVISTSHLPPSHLEYLTLVCKSDRPWPPCVQYHFPEGFVINTTRAPRFPNAPECGAFGLLVVAFSLAGFTHFKLDADGPVIKQLPTFKYE
jgi:hypothetical protein